jgi:lambda family phage portal protein
MGFIDKVLGRRSVKKINPSVRARIDIADRGDDFRHWQSADSFSMDAILNATTRRTIRNRARYERLNNSYLAGISETMASDLIGTGPRLQVTGADEFARRIEKSFYEWSTQIDLAGKLRTMRQAKLVDGEAFVALVTNPALPGVQLDLRLIEADQVATPLQFIAGNNETLEGSLVDGLEFDAIGNVIAFHVLKYHPGSNYKSAELDSVRIPADQMVHWFERIRPAQNRGLSEVAPCLRLFADLRRYTGAVIAAAETAADFAGIIHSNSPAAEVDEVEPFSAMEIEKRSLVTLPEGWDISQLRAEQPTAQFGDFRKQIISEIGRALQIPYAIAALDSSSHNYASARMDAQLYNVSVRVQRETIEHRLLDRLVSQWMNEAKLMGQIDESINDDLEWSWQWDGREHVDPTKEANALQTKLETHTTTLAAEYARQGKSWEQELQQRSVEIKMMKELDLFQDFSPEVNYGGELGEDEDSPGEAD